jgi:malate/lactate dehydrogenase
MKPSSAKAKGRNFQNKVREMIIEKMGMNEHDIKTAVMGESGMDIILSKA